MSRCSNLTREEVVEAICRLESESKSMGFDLVEKQKQIDDLIVQGKEEKNLEQRLLYAKKINAIKKECIQCIRRSMYFTYNLQLLNRIKDAIDDNQSFKKSEKTSLDKMFSDQKKLAKLLNRILNVDIKARDVLTVADELFKEIKDAYADSLSTYDVKEDETSILSVFDDVYEIERLICKWCGAPLKNVKVRNGMIQCDYCCETYSIA